LLRGEQLAYDLAWQTVTEVTCNSSRPLNYDAILILRLGIMNVKMPNH